MREITAEILLSLEKKLLKRGFSSPGARRLVAFQILVAGVSLALGLATVSLGLWPLAFGVGACLIAANLWWLARSAERALQHSFSAGLAALGAVSFLLRFAAMALALFVAIVLAGLPVIPLLAGLSSAVIGISILGPAGFFRQPAKEACHGRKS